MDTSDDDVIRLMCHLYHLYIFYLRFLYEMNVVQETYFIILSFKVHVIMKIIPKSFIPPTVLKNSDRFEII